jgi:cell division protein FtsA
MNEYGRLEVLGLGQAPCSGVVRGVVTNIDRTVDAIVKAINEAETQANVNILEVNVSISGQQIRSIRERTGFTRLSADKEITVEDVMRLNEDMRRIQPPVGNQILHVVPQDYSVDYASGIYDPVGMLGVKLEGEFHVITAPFAAIANIQKCIEKADRPAGQTRPAQDRRTRTRTRLRPAWPCSWTKRKRPAWRWWTLAATPPILPFSTRTSSGTPR